MKKKTLLIAGLSLLAVGFSAVALAGCGYKFEEYTYNYGGESASDWRALEYPDDNIQMDGLVKEEEYGKRHLSFSDVNGVNMKVYAHLGEEGVFFGFVSNDRYVNYNTRNPVYDNTSVEIQVAQNGTENLNSDVVQLRIGANGTPDQWVGFPSEDGYSYSNKYIPSMGAVHINGELNKTADGYSVEIYLPYTSFGLDEKPESVVCAPSFNTMPDPTNSSRATWTMMLGCDLGQPATWYVVDDTGMTAHTAGFQEKNAGIVQEKGYNEFYYFDTAPHGSYYLKTTLNVSKTTAFLNSDNFPKFGLVNKSENALEMFYIDAANKEGTNFGTVRAIQSTASGTSWLWGNNASTSIEGHWGNQYIGNYRDKQLETIYYEGDLYMILNGVLVKTVKNFSPESAGAVPGLVCFNTRATFKNNEFVTDKTLVKAELDKYAAKDRAIDGDLSDWTDADVNRHAKTVADAGNGNAMTVRAFRGTDGLYLAYEVDHRVNLTPSKWDDGWWKNTNIEFYVNGSGEQNHYALTSFGNSGYMDGVMISTRNPDRTYTTVGEIFVPFASLVKDGFNAEETLSVGFAFKSANGTADDKLNGVDWWTIEGTPNTVQIPVHAGGIGYVYTLAYAAGAGSDVTGNAPASLKVFAGDSVVLAQNPFTKNGYAFAGWTDGKNAYAANGDMIMPNGDVTLTPHWIQEGGSGATHSVAYAAGAADTEGTLPSDGSAYAAGSIVTLAQNTLTREGYLFVGWNDGVNTYPAGSTVFMGETDVTFTALWEKVYTLSYSAGTAEFEGTLPAEEDYTQGSSVIVKNVILSREEYDFFGWTDDENVYTANDVFEMPAENVTLTAVWKTKIKVDGKLTDWQAIDSKTVGAHSIRANDNRQATWYGVLRDDGLYLAVEIYHDQLGSGQNDWWKNLNFEIHVGKDNQQYYAYVASVSDGKYTVRCSNGLTASYTHADGTAKSTTHCSVFEIFLPDNLISGAKETDGSLRVGLAVKTNDNKESITGGSYNYGSGDPWYAPYGVLANVYDQFAFVTREGIYLKNEYLNTDMQFGVASAAATAGITLDGDISEWAMAASKTLNVTGTDLYNGKSVTFYGKMTQTGLYLAADVHHAEFKTGENDWWKNTNFELRIGEVWGKQSNMFAKQFYVYAVSRTEFRASESYMQVACKVEGSADNYHTVVEVFIPAGNLVQYDYMVQNGMIHVGVAWKTEGDSINNGAIGSGGVDPWWQPTGTHIETNPACVNGNGIYTAKEYAEL